MWPSLNETKSMWPSVGDKQGWNAKVVAPEPIYEARKGEKPRVVAALDVDNRRTMEAEITNRAVDFIKRNASTGKPFFAYVSFSLMHMPTLPNLEFAVSLATCPVHHPLAWQSASGPRQQRDRSHRGHVHNPSARGRSRSPEGSPD
jgi:hypothetical protein